jgi:hypothetical protein
VANPNDPKSRKVKLYAVTINLDQELDFNNYVKAIKKDLKTKLLSCLEA